MAVRIGKPAPEFEGEAWTRGAHGPKKVGLSQHRGKWIILFFKSTRFYIYLSDGNCIVWRDTKGS